MNLTICKNGHRYDPDLTPDCPECALLGDMLLAEDGREAVCARGHRYDPALTSSCPSCAAGLPSEEPDPEAEHPETWEREAYPRFPEGVPPPAERIPGRNLAGWLVCIDGPGRGSDFRLYYDSNYVGRGQRNEVCIPLDPAVSQEKHCVITYDWVDGSFYIAMDRGRSFVRLNGKPVLMTQALKRGDLIRIGGGTYRFVPFCDETFQWDEL